MVAAAFVCIYLGCIAHAAWTDVTKMKISNSISVILIVAFLIFAAIHFEPTSALAHIAVATAVFIVTFCCYAMRWMGGGDVKLLSALSIWIGPQQILSFLMAVAVLGGVLAAFVLCARYFLSLKRSQHHNVVVERIAKWATIGRVPYAVPIGAAALSCTGAIFSPWI